MFLINFVGTPATMELSGTSFVTTTPAATMEFLPTVIPERIMAPAPNYAFFLITTGLVSKLWRVAGFSECSSVNICTPGAIKTSSSIVMPP